MTALSHWLLHSAMPDIPCLEGLAEGALLRGGKPQGAAVPGRLCAAGGVGRVSGIHPADDAGRSVVLAHPADPSNARPMPGAAASATAGIDTKD